jgi:adenylyltransferase/sulfurtransferase
MPTCETDGVLGTAISALSALEATEAIKILVGSDSINRDLITMDVWDISFERFPVVKNEDCPTCGGRYEFLEDKVSVINTSLCGQSRAVQVVDTNSKGISLETLAHRLTGVQNVTRNEYMLKFDADDYSITVFPDGRAIIKNTLDESAAEQLYRKYIGVQKA